MADFSPFYCFVGLGQTIVLIDLNRGYIFQESWMTIPLIVLSFRSSKANTNNVSNIAGFLSLLNYFMLTAKIAGHVKSAVSLMSFFFP